MNKQETLDGIQAHIDYEDARTLQLLKELAEKHPGIPGTCLGTEAAKLSHQINESQKNKGFLCQWQALAEAVLKEDPKPASDGTVALDFDHFQLSGTVNDLAEAVKFLCEHGAVPMSFCGCQLTWRKLRKQEARECLTHLAQLDCKAK